MQEENSYSPSLLEISYSLGMDTPPMDRPRRLLIAKSQSDKGDKRGLLKEWSTKIGKGPTYLRDYIYKPSPQFLPEAVRHKLAKVSGIPEADLRGEDVRGLPHPKRVPTLKPTKDEFRFIGAYDQGASAGPGAFIDEGGVPMYALAFRRDWLRTITNATDDDLFVLFADGGSMEPTIHHGDSILVDKTQRNPRKDGIYVFIWDGLVNVKRLTSDPRTKTISVSSDNPAHDSFPGAKPEEIDVVGRVIWIGRKV